MVTYIIHEVWSNLCIQFSSVKKGHSLSSYRIPCAVPHLKPSSYQFKCFVMCTFAPTCTPHIPSQIHCNSPVLWLPCRSPSCSRGAKQMEALCKHVASLWSWFHLDFSISPRKTCTYKRSESDSFCKAGIDFMLANKPTWLIFCLVLLLYISPVVLLIFV